MNVTLIILLVISGVVVLAVFVVGLVYVAISLGRLLGGTAGGWRQLASAYTTTNVATGQISTRATIQVGAVTYKRCVTLGVADEGLYVTIWRTTALIPWNEFKAMGPTTLYWQQVPKFSIGDPIVATMTVPAAVFQAMQLRLPHTLLKP